MWPLSENVFNFYFMLPISPLEIFHVYIDTHAHNEKKDIPTSASESTVLWMMSADESKQK